MRKLFFLSLMLWCGTAFGAVTSIDNVFVANDQYDAYFWQKLNRNFDQLLTGGINNINGANIKDDSVAEADMADDANPRIRTAEGASCAFVYSGLLPATSASLVSDTSAGTAYPYGYRIVKASATTHTYTASKWTWVDLDTSGDFHYTEVAINGATPAVYSNSIRLAKVSSDGTTINTVTDLRTTSCTSGPYSIISDAAGEANLGNILSLGTNSGWMNGFTITTKDNTSVYINSGSGYINGQYRAINGTVTIDSTVPVSYTSGTSGIDAGSLAANTNYYVYAVADVDGITPPTGVLSTNPTTPAGSPTNYRRIGEVSTDVNAVFASSDPVTISYTGKILQIKKAETDAVISTSTAIPYDDTIPQNTEGAGVIDLPVNFTSANSHFLIFVQMPYAVSNANNIVTLALFRDSYASAIASNVNQSNSTSTNFLTLLYKGNAQKSGVVTFKVRAGAQANTLYVNGLSGGRIGGGVMKSSIIFIEYTS